MDLTFFGPKPQRLWVPRWSNMRWGCYKRRDAEAQRPLRLCVSALISFLTVNATAVGQQRPLLTEDPRLIRTGALVTETGFGYFNRARFPVSGLGGNQFPLLVGGLHFGLGPRAEFQITGTIHNLLQVREGGTGWRNDFGDGAISTKIKILEETASRPIVAFRPTIVLPNARNERGLGVDGTHFFGTVLLGKSVGRAFLFGNIGLGILDDAVRAAAQQDVLVYGIAAIVPIIPRFRLAWEWTGVENPQSKPTPGGEDRRQIRLGGQIEAGGVRWDVGAVAGLTRLDPRVGFVFGVTKEFSLWK